MKRRTLNLFSLIALAVAWVGCLPNLADACGRKRGFFGNRSQSRDCTSCESQPRTPRAELIRVQSGESVYWVEVPASVKTRTVSPVQILPASCESGNCPNR